MYQISLDIIGKNSKLKLTVMIGLNLKVGLQFKYSLKSGSVNHHKAKILASSGYTRDKVYCPGID